MQVEIIETSDLGDRSYVVHDGTTAVAIDPQRDIDRVLAFLDERDLSLAAVAETHIHNDYVTGGLELARLTGADYLVSGDDPVSFNRVPITDNEERQYGDLLLRAIHSPGHTHTHLSYALSDGGTPAVFTGGSLLFGSVGRTDLLGPEHTDTLTRAQFHTARRLVDTLPDETPVYPTHGFGSFCSSGSATGGDGSTIGTEKERNDALTTTDEDEFVERLVRNLTAYPAYYAHMGPRNLEGPGPVDLSAPEPVDPDELRSRIEKGEWVVDLRDRTLYPAGHLEGSLGIELGGDFSVYVGWLIPWSMPLTLIAESADDVAAAQRQLVRIGIDRPAGAAVGKIDELAPDGEELVSYPRISFLDLKERRDAGLDEATVLDVRRDDERAGGGIPGSAHVPIHALLQRIEEVPDGDLLVHCAAGVRAAIASSLLHRAGKQVTLIDDTYERATELGLTSSDV